MYGLRAEKGDWKAFYSRRPGFPMKATANLLHLFGSVFGSGGLITS